MRRIIEYRHLWLALAIWTAMDGLSLLWRTPARVEQSIIADVGMAIFLVAVFSWTKRIELE